MAQKSTQGDDADTKAALTFLQRFLNTAWDETTETTRADTRVRITTSTLEDYMHRGEHPILAPMSYQTYAMWVFRVELSPTMKSSAKPRFIDLDFAATYDLFASHAQRIATELRVPLFQGFTMPATRDDAETASLYKQLLLRPFGVDNEDTDQAAPDLTIST